MKPTPTRVIIGLAIAAALIASLVELNRYAPPAFAQSGTDATSQRQPNPQSAIRNPKSAVSRRSRQEARRKLEEEFQRQLTGAVLTGTWQMTNEEGLKGKAPLSDPRPEHYTIDKVSKASDDYWIITARIQYADKDVKIPVTVRVVWAEDVPIITLDETPLPGLGTYAAHVMIYKGFYCGTWFGKTYGGILSGQITHPATSAPSASQSEPRP